MAIQSDSEVKPDLEIDTTVATDSDVEMERLEEELRRALGTKVLLVRSRKGGRIVIEYYSDEEFSRLFDRLTGGVS